MSRVWAFALVTVAATSVASATPPKKTARHAPPKKAAKSSASAKASGRYDAPDDVPNTPAYHYAQLASDDCLAELDARQISYQRETAKGIENRAGRVTLHRGAARPYLLPLWCHRHRPDRRLVVGGRRGSGHVDVRTVRQAQHQGDRRQAGRRVVALARWLP